MTTAVTTPAASRPAASSGSLQETSPGPGPWGRGPGSARHAGGPAPGTQPEALSPGPGVGRSRTGVTGPPARAEGRAGTAGPGAGASAGRPAWQARQLPQPASVSSDRVSSVSSDSALSGPVRDTVRLSHDHCHRVTVNGDNGQGP